MVYIFPSPMKTCCAILIDIIDEICFLYYGMFKELQSFSMKFRVDIFVSTKGNLTRLFEQWHA
jgi:hypothetical protein